MNVMVLDTETCNTLDDALVYDIGFTIMNEQGEILATRSLAITDYFFNNELMDTAYYHDKIPKYWVDIAQGNRELKTLEEAERIVKYYIKRYNIQYVSCHNARFDYKALTTSQRYRTSSRKRYFLPKDIIIIDTLKMARQVLKDNAEYNKFCEVNGYRTKTKQNRYTAEVLYRFISGDNDFIEEHQGLDDTIIESKILNYLLQFMPIEQGKLWD